MGAELELRTFTQAVDALRHACDARRAAEVAELIALNALCELYRVDEDAALAGCERLIEGGADGTPLIGEFLALEVAGLLRLSPAQAAHRLAEALDLRHRHPRVWDAVLAGRVDPQAALLVARRSTQAELGADAAARVDAKAATALAVMPIGRVLRALSGWIVAADKPLAADRARRAAERRAVWLSPLEDGHRTLVAHLDPRDGADVDTAVGNLAHEWGAWGDERDLQVRRQRPRREALLVVHVARETLEQGDGVVRVEGHGPLLWGQLPQLLIGSRVVVQPVIDPAGIAPGDAYEIPDRMRLAVCQRNPVDVFPYGTRPSRSCQLDHTRPYRHDAPPGSGQTRPDNLGPLSTRAHRAKTHGGWLLLQPAPGEFEHTSPAGYRYTVTRHGTIAHPPPRREGDAPAPEPALRPAELAVPRPAELAAPRPALTAARGDPGRRERSHDGADEAYDAWLLASRRIPAWVARPWEPDHTPADAAFLHDLWLDTLQHT